MSRSAVIPGMRSPWAMRASDMPNDPREIPPPARRRRSGGPVEIYDPHRYARLVGEQTIAIPITAGGLLVLQEPDTMRNMLLLRNVSAAAVIFIAFGNNATANSALSLNPGTTILFDSVVPQDDVFALSDVAAGFLTIAQSVIPD